jgi:hypothetical protein
MSRFVSNLRGKNVFVLITSVMSTGNGAEICAETQLEGEFIKQEKK